MALKPVNVVCARGSPSIVTSYGLKMLHKKCGALVHSVNVTAYFGPKPPD